MTRIPSIVVSVLLSPVAGQSKIQPVEATAVLKDGEIITGRLLNKTVKIETDFGHAIVQAAKVASIQFGSPDVLLTSDKTRLRGKVVLPKSFRIKTAKETRTLHKEHVKNIAALGAAIALGPTFTGKWATTWGPMQLSQVGDKVKGTYGYSEKEVTGTLEDGVLEWTYDGGGEGKATLWKDGSGFKGTYKAKNGRESSWGGYRIRAAVAPPTPGKITAGQSKSWLNYHLRVPKKFDKSKRYPAIAFLHGSNMSSRAYVNTIASVWPKLAEEYILVGFDGQRMNGDSTPKRRSHNFTYVNFSGHKVGPMSVYRQSPVLVAEALDELKTQLPIDRWFLGGHSQGGFLTYAVFMFYPDAVAGVFPMSCNLLVQCDPDYHKDEALRKKQREVAIAVVHGENDSVVKFSGGEWCYRAMLDGGFPALRFFTDETAAHMFARLPVEKAVRWLEAMTATDATDLLSHADKALKEKRDRDAAAILQRIRTLGVPADLKHNVELIAKKIDERAKTVALKLLAKIESNANGAWVDGFLQFRENYAFADIAQPTMAAYTKLREQHQKPAEKLFYAARRLSDADQRNAKYQEIVDKYYASKWYSHVKGWLDDE